MKSEDPDDPQAWLSRARSNLKLAEKGGQIESVFLEDLCFNAQPPADPVQSHQRPQPDESKRQDINLNLGANKLDYKELNQVSLQAGG